VFGITDIAGEFHPIAYCITSHEKEEDFVSFLASLKKVAKELDIDFSPEYIMMDSSDATYNAVYELFPVESFNRQIKSFTQKKKLSIFGMLDKCSEMVHYYSTVQADSFNEYPRYIDSLNNLAKKIDKSLFKKVTNIKFSYKRWIINKTEQTCSCRGFLKHAICPHSLALSQIKDWNWFGPKYQTRSNEFVYKNKKGAKKGSRYKKSKSALEMDDD